MIHRAFAGAAVSIDKTNHGIILIIDGSDGCDPIWLSIGSVCDKWILRLDDILLSPPAIDPRSEPPFLIFTTVCHILLDDVFGNNSINPFLHIGYTIERIGPSRWIDNDHTFDFRPPPTDGRFQRRNSPPSFAVIIDLKGEIIEDITSPVFS